MEILPATLGKIEPGWRGWIGTDQPAATFRVILAAGQTCDLGGGAGTRVTSVNNGATLPAGVTLTGGKLRLVA